MFNRFEGIGNLVADPEMKYTPSGTAVTTARVAFTSKYKQGEEMKEDTLFVDCISFGKRAETIKQYCTKGMPVFAEGRLKMNEWEHEGKRYYRLECLLSALRFLNRKSNGNTNGAAAGASAPDEVSEVEAF